MSFTPVQQVPYPRFLYSIKYHHEESYKVIEKDCKKSAKGTSRNKDYRMEEIFGRIHLFIIENTTIYNLYLENNITNRLAGKSAPFDHTAQLRLDRCNDESDNAVKKIAIDFLQESGFKVTSYDDGSHFTITLKR